MAEGDPKIIKGRRQQLSRSRLYCDIAQGGRLDWTYRTGRPDRSAVSWQSSSF